MMMMVVKIIIDNAMIALSLMAFTSYLSYPTCLSYLRINRAEQVDILNRDVREDQMAEVCALSVSFQLSLLFCIIMIVTVVTINSVISIIILSIVVTVIKTCC